jgi:hypothetical protein
MVMLMKSCDRKMRMSCFRGMGLRGLWLVCGVGLAMLVASPGVRAGEADGFYRPTSLQGHVTVLGRQIDLPLGKVRDAMLTNGVVVVRANRMPVRTPRWGRVLENLGLFGIRGYANATGPDKIVLRKNRRGYAGRTATPVTTKIRGRYKRIPVTITMRTSLETLVVDDTLTIDAPVRISVRGIGFDGRVNMETKRVRLLPWR